MTRKCKAARALTLCCVMTMIASGCGRTSQSPQASPETARAAGQGESGTGNEVPQFKFDPEWPKRLPNSWVLGGIGALWVDSKDHVWVAQRPGSTTNAGDRWEFLGYSECCRPAPPVMEFDTAGNVVQAWGPLHELDGKLLPGQSWPTEMGEWPASEHGIAVDDTNNAVWVSNYYPPSQVVKYSSDGRKFLLRIGKKVGTSNSDTENLSGPTGILPDPTTNEVFIADGYQNRRIIVYDATTGAFKRMWGAYGKKPEGPMVACL